VAFPRFVTAEDPLHESYDPSIDGKSGTFIGLGLSFAKRALGSTQRDIILVPSAWSGTGFCNNGLEHIAWNADTPDPSSDWLGGTALHDRALARINIALEETGGILRGILWHQGEADANESACANDYAANLRALIASLRTRIQIDARGPDARGADALLPFVLGTMSRGDDERGTFSEFDPFKTTVDLVHRTLPTEVPGVAVTNNDDLVPDAYPCGQGSCIHFGAAAYREMGRRYFEELQALWTAADS
ncbi:MAG: sialate O-acetylesterase, partial [Gammaproteobacteria bacterium]|nr:sialate O-acetylesterase [Gammaproteobacteria bacterium]